MSNDVAKLQAENEVLRQDVAKMEALARLVNNPDFNQIIGEGYLRDEALRLVYARPGLHGSRKESVEGCDRAIAAIGEFRDFLQKIRNDGEYALEKIAENDESIAEILHAGAQ